GIGTPSTGKVVFDATIPGRCAAPPAAAMITSSPRASAPDAYSNIQSGVRCAETTFASCGTPSVVRRSIAGCMCFKSELLPMITPTSGFESVTMLEKGAGYESRVPREEREKSLSPQYSLLGLVHDDAAALHHPLHIVQH